MRTHPEWTGYGRFAGAEFKWRATQMQITIEKIPGRAPDKYIVIDGVRWGRTYSSHRGRLGWSYTIAQFRTGKDHERGYEIVIPRKNQFPGSSKFYSPEIYSASSRDWRNNGDNRSTDERIIDKVKELIEAGHFKSPGDAQAEAEQRMQEHRSAMAEIEAKKDAALRDKATEAVGERLSHDADLIARVVEAMKWAQSQ